ACRHGRRRRRRRRRGRWWRGRAELVGAEVGDADAGTIRDVHGGVAAVAGVDGGRAGLEGIVLVGGAGRDEAGVGNLDEGVGAVVRPGGAARRVVVVRVVGVHHRLVRDRVVPPRAGELPDADPGG